MVLLCFCLSAWSHGTWDRRRRVQAPLQFIPSRILCFPGLQRHTSWKINKGTAQLLPVLINHIKKISLRKELHKMATPVKMEGERWGGLTEVRWGHRIADVLDASSEASLLEFTQGSRPSVPAPRRFYTTKNDRSQSSIRRCHCHDRWCTIIDGSDWSSIGVSNVSSICSKYLEYLK